MRITDGGGDIADVERTGRSRNDIAGSIHGRDIEVAARMHADGRAAACGGQCRTACRSSSGEVDALRRCDLTPGGVVGDLARESAEGRDIAGGAGEARGGDADVASGVERSKAGRAAGGQVDRAAIGGGQAVDIDGVACRDRCWTGHGDSAEDGTVSACAGKGERPANIAVVHRGTGDTA